MQPGLCFIRNVKNYITATTVVWMSLLSACSITVSINLNLYTSNLPLGIASETKCSTPFVNNAY